MEGTDLYRAQGRAQLLEKILDQNSGIEASTKAAVAEYEKEARS